MVWGPEVASRFKAVTQAGPARRAEIRLPTQEVDPLLRCFHPFAVKLETL
jgi:hypothetical protein